MITESSFTAVPMSPTRKRYIAKKQKNLRVYLLSALFGILTCIFTLIPSAVILWKLELPVSTAEIFSLLAFSAGCIVSGLSIGKYKKKNGMKNGIKVAIIFWIIMLVFSLCFSGFNALPKAIPRALIAAISGGIGGIIGVR